MDSCTSVNLTAGNKKVPVHSDISSACLIIVGKDSNRKMCDKTKDHGNIGRTDISLSHKGE